VRGGEGRKKERKKEREEEEREPRHGGSCDSFMSRSVLHGVTQSTFDET
jgi:hypothetical protein